MINLFIYSLLFLACSLCSLSLTIKCIQMATLSGNKFKYAPYNQNKYNYKSIPLIAKKYFPKTIFQFKRIDFLAPEPLLQLIQNSTSSIET